MSERLSRYKYILDMGQNDWFRLIADPYVIAYDTAFESFKKHTQLQKEADNARAEMFVMAASIVTGTIFMATVASASVRLLARRSALAALGRQNLQFVFNAAKAAKNSEPFMFAVGKLLDEGKSQVTNLAQDQVKQLISANMNVVSDTPMVQSKHLDIMLRNHLDCGYKCGLAIEDSRTLSAADKDRAFAALRQAAICNPPKVRVDVAKLSAKIELCMYMRLILDSDRLVTRPAQPADREGRMAAAMMGSSMPIDKSPFAGDYPQSTTPRRIGMMNSSYQLVEFNRPGSIVRDRIDTLNKVAFKRGFYSKKGDLGIMELRAAENTLQLLARETRPMTLSDLKN
jgi:hypothetical protein